jgi:mannose-6-phosphate isomerase-like protein (cupin superfamily)
MAGPARAYSQHADDAEVLTFGEVTIVVRATGETTGGAYTLLEETGPVDTPLHVHAREDELFYIVEGEHVIRCGDEEFTVGPGAFVFCPRGVPHSQRRVVPRTGRELVLLSPPGLEGFFRDLAAADRAGTLGHEAYAAASEKYGIEWIDE